MERKDNNTAVMKSHKTIGGWIPRKVVQEFFNYGNTKMSTFAADYNIRVSKVGKRIFYKYSDILRLMNDGLCDNHN
ncbi:hypothetical protein [uncultured Psychroserpens sp.]|uniref:hypothetical protein n=1 Tax=uncultured Psychroserpens sp. TaxID=255436 RepID=UPI0026222CB6|nr:hypothetical protein [uncultured Psychroserpens sp.]